MQPQDPPQPQQPPQPQPNGQGQEPQPMYWTRPLDPQQPQMTDEIRRKCEESRQKYPKLNLSDGEYVISELAKHPIGLWQIWGATLGLSVLVLVMLGVMVNGSDLFTTVPKSVVGIVAFLLILLFLIGGWAVAWIYKANRLYLTNESVIQNIQGSLFANREQTVSLSNIEDASYTKTGILSTIFDYGLIRLSTEGDETTYRFSYAKQPKEQVAILNNAVESFKNGRPVEMHH